MEQLEQTELETLAALQKQVNDQKKRRKWIVLVLLLLLAAAIGGGFLIWKTTRPMSRYELDRNALEGFLPGHTQEEIQQELNRIIDAGRFGVSINPMPVLSDGKLNLLIENVPANHYAMQVDLYLTKSETEEELIYSSGVIQPGFYIESGETDKALAPGKYPARAVFAAIDPATGEEVGETAATVLVLVGEEGAK